MASPKAAGLFAGGAPRVRTIAPSAPFLELLADRLIEELATDKNPFALADALILVQNRRSVRALIEAFAARGKAMLLPAIKPLADVEDDSDVWGADPIAFNIPPLIDPLRRRLELAQLIRAKEDAEGGVADPAGAVAAADELCKLLDSAAAAENVDWSKLPHLVEDRDLARHWERSAKFLEIVSTYWPQRLAADGLTDEAARRNALHAALAESWKTRQPQTPIIIAGSTGSIASVRKLMGVVARLPRGVVILPGLDSDLDDAAWDEIDDSHPQHALKDTLGELGLDRREIPALAGAVESKSALARRVLVREALVPADRTADWLQRLEEAASPWGDAKTFLAEACAGLSLIEARNEEEEATIIALALREALETPGRTAALVTPDARLGQRVSAKLRRWNIDARASSGTPLADTSAGILLTLLADFADDDAEPVSLAALLKHPLTAFGDAATITALEHKVLRGPRKHGDLADIAQRWPDYSTLIETVADALSPLRDAFAAGNAEAGALANALYEAAERATGGRIWETRAGEAASSFLTALGETESALGAIEKRDAPRLVGALLFGRVAPNEGASHPRLAIWGPLEARLQQRDVMILGGLNEGAWPAATPDDPFLSRGLREALGLPATDSRIGLAAHDFAQLANAKRVVLTRSLRAGGSPTVASRWIWRLGTLARAEGGDPLAPDHDWRAWARALDKPGTIAPVAAPRPSPANQGFFIKRISVTEAETLIRDPYAVYARNILRLRVLRPIGGKPDARELGNAVHKALELFTLGKRPPGAPLDALMDMIDVQLTAQGFTPAQRAATRARLSDAGADFIAWNEMRDGLGFTSHLEKHGEIAVDKAVLVGVADRIDVRMDGRAEIIDFKTGSPPTINQQRAGFSPQLLLEAAMLKAGAFPAVPAAIADRLIYWRFAGTKFGEHDAEPEDSSVEVAGDAALKNLAALLEAYRTPGRAFLSKPRAFFAKRYDDYDHLARRAEWADAEEDDA